MNKTGSWSLPSNDTPREETKRLPFLDMKENGKSYKMRVASDDPHPYFCHWVTTPEGKRKVNCSETKDCPVVDEENKTRCGGNGAQRRWYFKVLDRQSGEIKVLDVGIQIFKQVVDLHNDEEWGHSKHYDITVKKGNKGDNPLYSVLPGAKKPLTPEEKLKIEASDDKDSDSFIDLVTRTKPMDVVSILKIMNGPDDSKARAGRTAPQTQPAPKKAAPAKTEESSEEDLINWGEDE